MAQGTAESKTQSHRQPRVLIGDDNAGFRELLAEYFAGSGFEVRTAATGPEVVEVAAELPVSVMLLDVRMPALSGLQAYRLAAEQLARHGVRAPAIFMTTGPTRELMAEARLLGALALLDKLQIQLDQLQRLVRAAMTPEPPLLREILHLLLDPERMLRALANELLAQRDAFERETGDR